jgi:predicted AAA+ superfamily ATPase
LVNSGHLLENLVYIALRRISTEIFYYKTNAGREVDFIIQDHYRTYSLVQVCESLADPRTLKRETTALAEAMAELHISQATIVTRAEETQLAVTSGDIYVVPVWRFLLDIETPNH